MADRLGDPPPEPLTRGDPQGARYFLTRPARQLPLQREAGGGRATAFRTHTRLLSGTSARDYLARRDLLAACCSEAGFVSLGAPRAGLLHHDRHRGP
jgi:hypothetical protein